jgi:UDP-GlcNAc:undecaprenyl-phosphate GlcNAc-1-phosphate transferase
MSREVPVLAYVDATIWLVTLATGFLAGLVFTRIGRGLAPRLGMVDHPDGGRKAQARPVPVVGGVAVLAAALVALAAATLASPEVAAALATHPRESLALLAAAVLIAALGLLDDRYDLRARYKVLGQLAAIGVLIFAGGLRIELLGLLGWEVDLGPLWVPVTAFWLLACINALNLIDGMDGLLGTIGLIALVSLAVVAAMVGHLFAVAVALALAGAVLGFLRYNLPPASVYMGDAGSMLIGLVIGALAVTAQLKASATVVLAAPIAILILPMLDTTAAVVRRKLTGRGLAAADRGHLHHVLQKHGLTARRVLALVAALGLVASTGALATVAFHNDVYALVGALSVVVALVATKLFGYAELVLVRERVTAAFRALRTGPTAPAWELAVRLQGTADWDEVWQDLTGCAGRLGLQTVWLDVNAPAVHESFHARWDRSGVRPPEGHLWRVEIPLFSAGRPVGRLTVVGGRDEEPITDKLLTVAKIIEVAEVRVAEVTSPARMAGSVAVKPEPVAPRSVEMV